MCGSRLETDAMRLHTAADPVIGERGCYRNTTHWKVLRSDMVYLLMLRADVAPSDDPCDGNPIPLIMGHDGHGVPTGEFWLTYYEMKRDVNAEIEATRQFKETYPDWRSRL